MIKETNIKIKLSRKQLFKMNLQAFNQKENKAFLKREFKYLAKK